MGSKVSEPVRENVVGKTSFQMRLFFGEMVKNGELTAYGVQINKMTGRLALTPIKELPICGDNFVVEDPKTKVKYNLNVGSHGGMFCNDGDSQTIYHHCVLEKLAKQADSVRVSRDYSGNISIPQEVIDSRLRASYDEDWESGGSTDYIAGTRGNLTVEGEKDGLFEKVCGYVRAA